MGAVGLLISAQTHRATVPGDLAHVGQRTVKEAATGRQAEHPHGGSDPLLRFAALAHGHEELDGALDGTAIGALDRQEGDDEVEALLAFVRPVLDLLGHGVERALRPALDHLAHRILLVLLRGGLGLVGRLLFLLGRLGFQHGAQDGVGPVGGQTLEAGLPGLLVQVLEVFVRVVGRDVDGLGDGGVNVGLHGFHHRHVLLGRHGQGVDEVVGQVVHITTLRLEQPPGVILDHVFAAAAVGLALAARVGPGERRLDAVAGVVGKGQADRAGRRDGQQVAVADAVLADVGLDVVRQARGEAALTLLAALAQVAVGIELREGALFLGQLDRGTVGGVAHGLGNAGGHGAALGAVVAQLQHGQRVAQAGEAHADAALGGGFGALLVQRPEGHVQHVVQRAHLDGHHVLEGGEVEGRLAALTEGVAHEAGEDDGAQVAAAIGRQRLLTTGVGGLDGLAVVEVVVATDGVEEQDAGLGEVVGGLHDGVPQLPGRHAAVDPLAVVTLVGAGGHDLAAGAGAVHQIPVGVVLQRLHEGVGDADRDVEVVPAARGALGGDEVQHVRMVDAQHAHLGATAAAGALDGGAALVEDVDVAARAGGDGVRALDLGAIGADAGEVVADAAAATHGLGRLAQGLVDAGVALVVVALDAVTHGLHETVDEGGLDVGTGCTHDAARADGTGMQVAQELRFPLVADLGLLDRGQRARHPGKQLGFGLLTVLQVLLGQHILADGLDGQRRRGVGGRQDITFHRAYIPERQGATGHPARFARKTKTAEGRMKTKAPPSGWTAVDPAGRKEDSDRRKAEPKENPGAPRGCGNAGNPLHEPFSTG